jgi:hypothetical protein
MPKPIQAIGVKQLNDEEKSLISKLAERNFNKLLFKAKKLESVVVHIKTFKTTGKRKKYSIKVKAVCGRLLCESSEATSWDLATAVHKAFNDAQKQLIHRFRTDTSYRKRYE